MPATRKAAAGRPEVNHRLPGHVRPERDAGVPDAGSDHVGRVVAAIRSWGVMLHMSTHCAIYATLAGIDGRGSCGTAGVVRLVWPIGAGLSGLEASWACVAPPAPNDPS